MQKSFNLRLAKGSFSEYYSIGRDIYSQFDLKVNQSIDAFKNIDGSLNASKMKASWFPEFKADVFVSHSHSDKELAVSLAGWLYDEFKLISFIDSCVWGHANDLLKIIDRDYCYDPDNNTYNYEMRNLSTAHVYMMLSTALVSMMDESDSLFFLNTPSSIDATNVLSEHKRHTSPNSLSQKTESILA